MNVHIEEASMSFGVQYTIQTPSSTLTASKKILSLLPHITLNAQAGGDLATIEGVTFFVSRFTITLSDGRVYTYHTEKLWKGVDICEGPSGPYHLYRHKGTSYSIFQGDTQIAAFSRNKLIFGNGKKFDLQMNADADLNLLICMVLCVNTENGNDNEEGNTVTYDFGSFGPEDRTFDENWKPNDER